MNKRVSKPASTSGSARLLTNNSATVIVALIGMVGGIASAFIASSAKSDAISAKTKAESALEHAKLIDYQIGTFRGQIGDADWALGESKKPGQRTKTIHVVFSHSFAGTPNVFTSINSIDADRGANLRILTYPQNITAEGFDVVMQTWSDSKINFLQGTWAAYQQ